jgi:hypothetical protein
VGLRAAAGDLTVVVHVVGPDEPNRITAVHGALADKAQFGPVTTDSSASGI